jgi:hypothetical protein
MPAPGRQCPLIATPSAPPPESRPPSARRDSRRPARMTRANPAQNRRLAAGQIRPLPTSPNLPTPRRAAPNADRNQPACNQDIGVNRRARSQQPFDVFDCWSGRQPTCMMRRIESLLRNLPAVRSADMSNSLAPRRFSRFVLIGFRASCSADATTTRRRRLVPRR